MKVMKVFTTPKATMNDVTKPTAIVTPASKFSSDQFL